MNSNGDSNGASDKVPEEMAEASTSTQPPPPPGKLLQKMFALLAYLLM